MQTSKRNKYIAVIIGFVFFVYVFFGNTGAIFPKIPFLDLFGSVVTFDNINDTVSKDFNRKRDQKQFGPSLRDSEDPNLKGLVSIFDIKEGTGLIAGNGSIVSVVYYGYMIDSKDNRVVFDSNTSDSLFMFEIGKNQVIPGFEGGIIGMREGGQRLVIIEPAAGYGDKQQGPIPPDTTLYFEIELYEVK